MTLDLNTANFETLMAELKKTLTTLENGDLPLEESMKAYEMGVTLVRTAEQKLASMEGRMEEILADGSKKTLEISDISGAADVA
jgi:exodeoxyribonuclease VII small subunit